MITQRKCKEKCLWLSWLSPTWRVMHHKMARRRGDDCASNTAYLAALNLRRNKIFMLDACASCRIIQRSKYLWQIERIDSFRISLFCMQHVKISSFYSASYINLFNYQSNVIAVLWNCQRENVVRRCDTFINARRRNFAVLLSVALSSYRRALSAEENKYPHAVFIPRNVFLLLIIAKI